MRNLSDACQRAMSSLTTRAGMMTITAVITAMSVISTTVHANVVISATRAIVPLPPGHTSLRLNNTSAVPTLVQMWADSGDAQSTPDSADAPFEITPPLFVLGPNESQVVRIDYDDDPANAMLTKRESLYWLNVLDVPSTGETQVNGASGEGFDQEREDDTRLDERDTGPSADDDPAENLTVEPAAKTTTGTNAHSPASTVTNGDAAQVEDNALRFVVHTRIKLIARPRGLPGNPLHAPAKVTWRIVPAPGSVTLAAKNTSAYYVTCAPVFVVATDRRERNLGTHTIAPGESLDIRLDPQRNHASRDRHDIDEAAPTPWAEAVCHAINDYGSIDVFRSRLGETAEDAQ